MTRHFPSAISQNTQRHAHADRRSRVVVSVVLAASAFMGPLSQAAHAAGTDAAAQQRYKTETAACASKPDAESRKTCLKEAGAAKAEAGQGRLATPGADLAANAKARCDALPGDQRTTCLERMGSAGVTSGSVEGGGVLRELTTRTPAASAAGAGSAARP
ncbi:MAG: hypothetical protein M3Y32_00945 [Pseudomonadota bacterium]|nr:hypothetical protein [Pseudomonadota bacterium]